MKPKFKITSEREGDSWVLGIRYDAKEKEVVIFGKARLATIVHFLLGDCFGCERIETRIDRVSYDGRWIGIDVDEVTWAARLEDLPQHIPCSLEAIRSWKELQTPNP